MTKLHSLIKKRNYGIYRQKEKITYQPNNYSEFQVDSFPP